MCVCVYVRVYVCVWCVTRYNLTTCYLPCCMFVVNYIVVNSTSLSSQCSIVKCINRYRSVYAKLFTFSHLDVSIAPHHLLYVLAIIFLSVAPLL